MAMPRVPNTNAGSGTIPGEARTIPTIAVNTINKLTLGFVSARYARHPGRDSAAISESWGATANAALPLHLQLHQSIHGHHVVIQIGHDDHRPEYQETHDENAKR